MPFVFRNLQHFPFGHVLHLLNLFASWLLSVDVLDPPNPLIDKHMLGGQDSELQGSHQMLFPSRP